MQFGFIANTFCAGVTFRNKRKLRKRKMCPVDTFMNIPTFEI
jgi:hypothetical protein